MTTSVLAPALSAAPDAGTTLPAPAAPYVVVSTPCYGGLMTHTYVTSLLKLMVAAPRLGFRLGLSTAAHDSLVTRSRNTLVKQFLDTPGATHMLFIDADIGFEPEAVARLVDLGVEVAAGMYPVKVIDWDLARARLHTGSTASDLEQAGMHFVGKPSPPETRGFKNGFVTGTFAGTGFMLITRGAIERMMAEYPELRYRNVQTYPARPETGAPPFALFDCMIDPETGTYLSEDYAFCQRFRRIGGTVWLDTESKLHHVGSMEFVGHAAPALAFTGVLDQAAE